MSATRSTARAAALLARASLTSGSCCRAAGTWNAPSGSGRSTAASAVAAVAPLTHTRGFAAGAAPAEDLPATSDRVQKVAADILALNLLEVAELTELLQDRLGVAAPAFGGGFAGGVPMAAAGAPAAGGAAAAPAAAPAEEKTEFSVKLDGFADGEKIKVIKEVRAATELGLKEAKELVEKSPIVIKGGLKKEDAEALKAKLEAAGGKVSLE